MVTAVVEDPYVQFLAGLVIGVFLGLLLGPLLRSWLVWREWVEASREADLTNRLLERLEEDRVDDETTPESPARSSPVGLDGSDIVARPAKRTRVFRGGKGSGTRRPR